MLASPDVPMAARLPSDFAGACPQVITPRYLTLFSRRTHLRSSARELNAPERLGQCEAFGHAVMGPILADMLRRLLGCLHDQRDPGTPVVVFFCARGGLTLRHTLELFVQRLKLDIPVRCEDFMVSRLTAARTALQYDPAAIAPLIEQEFANRTCAEAARALTNIDVGTDSRWNLPFTVARWLDLTAATETGRRISMVNSEQADLLRQHINALCGPSRHVTLCDTGVFGSIAQYLHVGVPTVDWHSILLFRANYKHIPAPHFEYTRGIVSESDSYLPWRAFTAVLLYWQLMEAFLEPDLSSVGYYQANAEGRVISDLETNDWRQRLSLQMGSMLAGACAYLGELTPRSMSSIRRRGQMAWSQLRRMIVFPTRKDVELLSVGERAFNFGSAESAEFSSLPDHRARSWRAKFAAARDSMWPEGELRKQFPSTAGVFLLGWELMRLLRALQRQSITHRTPDNS